ncbi:MAG: VCBS repeat-containing protein [bacterium]|nr:VCBS repeat-containing protein [bacterium]
MRRPALLGSLPLAWLALAACHHQSSGFSLSEIFPALQGQTFAYLDVDGNGEANAGDHIILPMTRRVRVTSTAADAFELAVTNDSFGDGATLQGGPAANEVTIVLGVDPELRTRGPFDSAALLPSEPSGLRVRGSRSNAVEDRKTGGQLRDTRTLDIVPGLADRGQTSGSLSSGRLEAADFNCDGIPDFVAMTASPSSEFEAWLSQPGFQFVTLPVTSTVGEVQAIAVGDLDGDRRPEVLIAGPDSVQIFQNTSPDLETLELTTGQVVEAPGGTADLLLADLDSDGDLDFVRTSASEQRLEWRRNRKGELFSPIVLPGPNELVRALDSGDYDGDGDADLIAGGASDSHPIWNEGCDSFFLGQPLGVGDVLTIASRDLDQDGADDAVLGRDAQTDVALRSGPSGPLTVVATLAGAVATTRAVALADLDRDGAIDVVVGADDGLRTFYNDGFGELVFGRTSTITGVLGVVTGDYDGDGDADAVVASEGALRFAGGSSAGTWGDYGFPTSVETTLGIPGSGGPIDETTLAVVAADVDGDGFADVVAGTNAGIDVRRGNAQGEFLEQLAWIPTAARMEDLAIGDVDRDGDLDLVGAQIGDGPFVYLNDGSGAFEPASFGGDPNLFAKAVALGDIDQDGDLDIVLGTLRTYNDLVIENRGTDCPPGGGGDWLGFAVADRTLLETDLFTGDVQLADLECDGDLDLLMGHGPGEPGTAWANVGGTFVRDPSTNLGDPVTRALVLGDFDGDGDLDLVAGTGQNDLVWRNDGVPPGGLFTNFTLIQELPATDTRAIALGDWNGDGKLDIATAPSTGELRVVLGDGSGTFDAPLLLPAQGSGSLASVDVDRDGDLELLVGRWTSFRLDTWLNRR